MAPNIFLSRTPIAASRHFPRKRGKNHLGAMSQHFPPPFTGEVSAKLTEGGTS